MVAAIEAVEAPRLYVTGVAREFFRWPASHVAALERRFDKGYEGLSFKRTTVAPEAASRATTPA